MSSRRCVRVGLVLDGTLIEERVLPAGADVTVGRGARCALSLPLAGLPSRVVVLRADGDGYRVPGASARLADDARGKVELGELTLLYQVIREAPVMPRPRLPASLRGRWLDRVDARLGAILALSIAANVAIAVYARAVADPELPESLVARADASFSLEQYTITVADPPVPPPVATTPGTAAPALAPTVATASTPSPTPTTHTGAHRDDSSVGLPTSAAALAAALTSDHDDDGFAHAMASRQPGADLGQALAAARAHDHAASIGPDPSSIDHDPPRLGTSTAIDPSIATLDPSGHKPDHEQGGTIGVDHSSTPDVTSLTADDVRARILAVYLPAIQRCYAVHLLVDPTSRGKVALRLTVDAGGHATDNHADGVAAAVDTCIDARMNSWTFTPPRDGDGKATSAHFALALQLIPD